MKITTKAFDKTRDVYDGIEPRLRKYIPRKYAQYIVVSEYWGGDYDALFVLRRVYIERGDYYSYGLFTAENSGGVLSLDFTPVSWEHCNTELECDEKKVDLNKIEF